MLPIVVITTRLGSPAALALTTEGLEVTEVLMRDYTNYGRAFTEQWLGHRGFILVEEDCVPWPGGLQQLVDCEHEWCAFGHPRGDQSNGLQCAIGLGCMKFSTSLVERYYPAQVWSQRGWDELDGAVHATLNEGGDQYHLHHPPVAHCHLDFVTLRRGRLPV